MSQAKVEKRKYEKHHRKEIERKKRIKTATTCISIAVVIGLMIGIPLGIGYYRSIPKFVGDNTLKAFVANYIDENHAEDIAVLGTASTEETSAEDEAEASDSVEDMVKDAVEDASGAEVEEVNEENADEVLGTDAE